MNHKKLQHLREKDANSSDENNSSNDKEKYIPPPSLPPFLCYLFEPFLCTNFFLSFLFPFPLP